MTLDAHYVVGNGHAVCQDYALVRETPAEGFAVLCDGCSASEHSDVGARLLSLSIAATMERRGPSITRALRRARALCRAAGLPLRALDATVLVLHHRADTVSVSMFGDGYLYVRSPDGSQRVACVAFEGGAPDYPAYDLDPRRRRAYASAGFGGRTIETTGGELPQPVERGRGLRWEFTRAHAEGVFVASDGVGAVIDATGSPIPAPTVLSEICPSGRAAGSFVRRRLRRFAGRELAQKRWRTHDDLAVAGFVWPEVVVRHPVCP